MEFFHVLNRGVEKRDVFLDDSDRLRFIHDLYIFNDSKNAPNSFVKERQGERMRDLLVRIHAFALMSNHYHLLLSPVKDGGLSLFMRKLNMGYAKYFNEKYGRNGVLWQGVSKRIPITRDAHFSYIPYYIHLNPLDVEYPEWRTGEVKRCDDAIAWLDTYRWSSYIDYNGRKNFPSVIYQPALSETLGSYENQRRCMVNIISNADIAKNSTRLER